MIWWGIKILAGCLGSWGSCPFRCLIRPCSCSHSCSRSCFEGAGLGRTAEVEDLGRIVAGEVDPDQIVVGEVDPGRIAVEAVVLG